MRQGIPKKWENHVWSYTFLKVTCSFENQLTLAKFTILDFAVENKPVEYYMTLGNKGEIKNEGNIVSLLFELFQIHIGEAT